MGSSPATAADFTPNPSPKAAPSARPAAGPENAAAAGSRPVSGRSPAAGPKFTKSGSTWQVITPAVILRNTVTDADGDRSTLTFEVWTTNPNGTPKAQVKLTDANPYGVLVSPFVASGALAKVPVPYGKLKPGVTYTFRTNAFDGSLYETTWSPWANFKIVPYVTFPAPQATSTINPVAQTEIEFTRTDPGPALPAAAVANGNRNSGEAAKKGKRPQVSPDTTSDAKPGIKQSCSKADAKGHKLCVELNPPDKNEKKSPYLTSAVAPASELVAWCHGKPLGKDYMNRTDACMKSVGNATLIFTDTDPQKPALGTATFSIEQRIKAYPTKGDSGSNFPEFDQQIVITPRSIDPLLKGVTLRWNVGNNCSSCVTSNVRWTDDQNNSSTGYWSTASGAPYSIRRGNVTTQWNGTGKETIDLGWSITANVDAGGNPATADFGTSGVTTMRELAPRCDNISGSAAPGCVLPFFKPTYTVDTNFNPAAGAYYWLMQEKMPDHAGAKRWDSLLKYLGPDSTTKGPDGTLWTSAKSRAKICPSAWTAHPTDSTLEKLTCDEYAMASTHHSGGFPGGVNEVASGDECAQLYTDRMGDGSANFGLLADTRIAADGPTGAERCGRAAIPTTQNSGAFKQYPAPAWRLLDKDEFFVSNPGFEHCTSAATTCAWRKV
ncbi:hypothetical protein [Streptomyces sp. NBC_00690]|uniref:hypothetical protein n=1 Tax=Streptomyces sp. NBC_00690 TaxID=2975808 RepID=UPI002E29184E|nr:hypothetical protein [Streptomyces sp. NBC_00690]